MVKKFSKHDHIIVCEDMKKKVLWMLAAILTCGLTMTSCFTEDNPVGGDISNGKKLTILYYGNAGGDLDDCL